MGLCEFYEKKYKPEVYAISIAMPEGPFINRKQLKDYLILNFPIEEDQNRIELIRTFDEQAFVIADPFDWTSNYGKPVTFNSSLFREYLNMFQQISIFMTT